MKAKQNKLMRKVNLPSLNSKPNPTNGVNTLFVGFFYVL